MVTGTWFLIYMLLPLVWASLNSAAFFSAIAHSTKRSDSLTFSRASKFFRTSSSMCSWQCVKANSRAVSDFLIVSTWFWNSSAFFSTSWSFLAVAHCPKQEMTVNTFFLRYSHTFNIPLPMLKFGNFVFNHENKKCWYSIFITWIFRKILNNCK